MYPVRAALRGQRALAAHATALASGAVKAFSAAAALPAPEVLAHEYLVPTYSTDGVRVAPGLVFVRGEGCNLIDNHGEVYLDWAAGIAVNALGHSDAGVADVLATASRTVQHTSNLFHTYEPLLLARDLVQSTQHFKKVFLCNSGTEANEAAIKFARKHALVRHAATRGSKPAAPKYACRGTTAYSNPCCTTGGTCACWPEYYAGKPVDASDPTLNYRFPPEYGVRPHIVAFKGGFHGRSLGSLSTTHKPAIRSPFGPFPGDVTFAAFNDLTSAADSVNAGTAAIMVEPVQGEGGIIPATVEFMQGLRALADKHNALLIVDEVQCGLGRSGRLWAHEAYGVRPDIMTLAKPLAGGLPIGAVLVSDAVSACISPGDHGTTFGGNPLVAAVARHVFARIAAPTFLQHTRECGAQLLAGLRKLQHAYPAAVKDVRGTLDSGLFAGMELTSPPKALVAAAAKRKLLIITAGEQTIRICPPLIITKEQVADGLTRLGDAMKEVYGKAA